MARVADYSAGFPGAAALKKAGYVGAVRYIGLPGYRKCTTKAELDDFVAHELGMALVFEHLATDWRGGYNAGRANMRRALDHAYAIGWPADDRPIYMAVDQDVVTATEFDTAMSYLAGAADAHKGKSSTGPYGEYDVCARSLAAGFAWQWQCRAWSGTRTYPHGHLAAARLYQYYGHPSTGPGGTAGPNVVVNGIECDTNEVLHPDWGQGDEMIDYDRIINETAAKAAEKTWAHNVVALDGGQGPAGVWMTDANGHGWHLRFNLVPQLLAGQAQLIAAAGDEAVTPEFVERTTFAAAMAAAREQATLVIAGIDAGLRPLVQEALVLVREGDNADEVQQLLERIATLVNQPDPDTVETRAAAVFTPAQQ